MGFKCNRCEDTGLAPLIRGSRIVPGATMTCPGCWDRRCKEAAITAIWTDGPDSEAGRAFRGEGTTDAGARKRMWSGLGKVVAELAPAPDPTHTPAVRRVVAWVGDADIPSTCIGEAYSDAANALVSRSAVLAATARGVSVARFFARWPKPRRQRLAAYLRHRDEKAGWR